MLEKTHITHYDNGMISFVRQNTIEVDNLPRLDGERNLFSKGWGCGYVAIPKGHKYYGVPANNIPVLAHDGLTYSHEEEIEGITYWVVGFDTDGNGDDINTCNEYYVVSETELLYTQLKQIK